MRPPPRLHPVIAALPLAAWTVLHVWEQWPAFAGRTAWTRRMDATSRGGVAIAIEIVAAILPLLAWAALAILDRRPRAAHEDDPLPARALARMGPIAAWIALAFVVVHVAHLWGPKIVLGASLPETWWALTHDLGRPWMLVLYAIGLSAVAVHLAVGIPLALEALGWIETASARRQALLVSSVFAICVWILTVQLTGWVATGHGTFWSIEVIEPEPS